ncbi:MAG: PilZ domain-containing protein [Acidobacteriota bacterium]
MKKLLLSDDIGRALDRADCFLHRTAFDLIVGRSGEEILDLILRERPCAAMFNYYLAGLKGDEVCRRIRRSGLGRGALPVLIVGPPEPADIPLRCRQAECDEYIESPADPDVLLHSLAGALGIQFRRHVRVPAVISISFGRIVSEFLGYTRDISEGGMLVETSVDVHSGKRLYLRIFLGEKERPIVARATVLRVHRPHGAEHNYLGLQFQKMDTGSATRLKEFIRARAQH